MNRAVSVEAVGGINVSRETSLRLEHLVDLLSKWNQRINLVAPSTVTDIWTRHVKDSAQILSHSNADEGRWLDLGTGGGFPGMVVAILAAELRPRIRVTCIESDIRKGIFLRTVAREIGLDVEVMTSRIEAAQQQNARVVSARALAPLTQLLGYTHRHLAADGEALFLKGRSWQSEVETALETWRFTVESFPSITNSDSVILKIGGIERV